MDFTLHYSFKPFLKFASPSFLPPYSHNYKIGYFTTFVIIIYVARALPLFIAEKEIFAEMFTMVITSVQMIIRGLIFLWKKKPWDKYFNEVNKYIQDNKHNPIIAENDYFLKIWSGHFAFTHIKLFFIIFAPLELTWQIPALYDLATNIDNATVPYYALYSPYFDYNSFTKIGYTLMDIAIDWTIAFNYIHNETVYISVISFLQCQYFYSKQLLDKICIEEDNNPEKIKWWINNHCIVLRYILINII